MCGNGQRTNGSTGDGVVMDDIEFNEYELAVDALAGSVFRMLRQGQRVMFEVNDAGGYRDFASATHLIHHY